MIKQKKSKVISNLPAGMKFDIEQGYKFQEFENKLSKHLYKILKPGGFYLSFSQPRLYHRMTVAIEDCGFEIRDMIVWKRRGQAKAFSQNHFIKKLKISDMKKQKLLKLFENKKTPQLMGLHEDICVAQKPKDGTFIENYIKYKVGLINTKFNNFPSNLLTVEKYEKSEHLTSKPIKLIEQLIRVFTNERAIILDPFLGSGTTAIACKNTNRRCIGIELSKEYFKLCEKRIKEYRESLFRI